MALKLSLLFVGPERMALRWTLVPAAAGAVTFEIWRSGNMVTGFEKVHETESVVYLDRLARTGKFMVSFYRIEAVIGGVRQTSNVAGFAAPPDDVATRLAKRERFQLAKFDGVPALVFCRRRSGPACGRCAMDPVRSEAGVQCTICYGTGYDGGYYPAIPIYLSAQTLKSEGADLGEDRVAEASVRNLWTSNWTLISPEDVLVELVVPNRTWHVTGVQRSERFRAPIRQLMTVKEADLGDALSRLPVPDIAFPERASIRFFDPVGGRDFDTVFNEVLDAAAHSLAIPGREAIGPLEPVRPVHGAGTRDPVTGFYA